VTRPDGTEKWVGRQSLPLEVVEDPALTKTLLDATVRQCAEQQGATLVEYISTDLHPQRWVEATGGQMVEHPCGREDADHYLAVVKWWARPPADRHAVTLDEAGTSPW
jgi:hypothetical protein